MPLRYDLTASSQPIGDDTDLVLVNRYCFATAEPAPGAQRLYKLEKGHVLLRQGPDDLPDFFRVRMADAVAFVPKRRADPANPRWFRMRMAEVPDVVPPLPYDPDLDDLSLRTFLSPRGVLAIMGGSVGVLVIAAGAYGVWNAIISSLASGLFSVDTRLPGGAVGGSIALVACFVAAMVMSRLLGGEEGENA